MAGWPGPPAYSGSLLDDGRSNCWALGQRGSNIASGLLAGRARRHSHLAVILSQVKQYMYESVRFHFFTVNFGKARLIPTH